MKLQSIAAAKLHALKMYPRESCGLVVVFKGREKYIPCRNKSLETDSFEIHEEDWAAAEDMGEIITIVHSHVNKEVEPSEADIAGCKRSGLTWLIVGCPEDAHTIIVPEEVTPLVGRVYEYRKTDCLTLLRDYYRSQCGIMLGEYDYGNEWWLKGGNLYLENYEKEGFVQINRGGLKEHDMILMRVKSPVPNHSAVYLEGDRVLHHVFGRLSSIDAYGAYWREVSTHFLRHRSFV